MTFSRIPDDDGVTTVVMDDGKVNAFDIDFFRGLEAALDECAEDAAVVLAGRPGMFSAGLNMKVMAQLDEEAMTDFLVQFGRTILRVWLEPRPVVAAATGHAIAGGTLLAMACDHAVAADGDFRWGLTETTIGFPLPAWAITLARANVAAHRLDDLLLPGRIVDSAEAVAVGFADEVAGPDDVLDAAVAHARALTELPRPTYAETKRRLREAAARAALDGIERDTRDLVVKRTPPAG